jgi:hypothetical protein
LLLMVLIRSQWPVTDSVAQQNGGASILEEEILAAAIRKSAVGAANIFLRQRAASSG